MTPVWLGSVLLVSVVCSRFYWVFSFSSGLLPHFFGFISSHSGRPSVSSSWKVFTPVPAQHEGFPSSWLSISCSGGGFVYCLSLSFSIEVIFAYRYCYYKTY